MFLFSNIKLVSARIQSISIHSIHFHGFKVYIKKMLIHFNLFSFIGMYKYLLQQPKYRYLENLLAPIEEIGYFTFSNNNDVVSNETLLNSIFVFDDVTSKMRLKNILRWVDTRTSISSICVRRKHTEAFYTR